MKKIFIIPIILLLSGCAKQDNFDYQNQYKINGFKCYDIFATEILPKDIKQNLELDIEPELRYISNAFGYMPIGGADYIINEDLNNYRLICLYNDYSSDADCECKLEKKERIIDTERAEKVDFIPLYNVSFDFKD